MVVNVFLLFVSLSTVEFVAGPIGPESRISADVALVTTIDAASLRTFHHQHDGNDCGGQKLWTNVILNLVDLTC